MGESNFNSKVGGEKTTGGRQFPRRDQFKDSSTVEAVKLPNGDIEHRVIPGSVEGYAATSVGQILISTDGTGFQAARPLITDTGFIIVNDLGHIVVV